MSLRTRITLLATVLVIAAALAAAGMQIGVAEVSRDALPRHVLTALLTALAAGLIAGGIAGWLARPVTDSLEAAVDAAESFATGDLSAPVRTRGPGEGGRLLGALAATAEMLGGLLARIRAAGGRLAAVEADAAAALAQQERAVHNVSGSAHEISAAVTEISATSEHLLDATKSVQAIAREAADVADQGRGGLESMTTSMQQLDEAMNAFTRKLSTISQRAAGITGVVTTIAKVAEQTNLLSVNATIEAEKAGESGRGFRIVAQEIRRLADQTALATKDIERMVRDMQAAVASGTMEMDRFRNEVSGRIGEVAGVSERLGRIIDPVHSVTRSLAQVHEGMQAQSAGARQIRDAMEKLRGDAGDSASSLATLAAALEEVRRAIGAINTEAGELTLNGGSSADQPGTAAGP